MDAELGLLLSLDGAAHETAPGAIVEFAVRRTKVTPQPRMHQLRAGAAAEGGWSAVGAVRHAHAVNQRGRGRKRVFLRRSWFGASGHGARSPRRCNCSTIFGGR